MHELALAEGLVDLVAERTVGRQVVASTCAWAHRSGVIPTPLRSASTWSPLETPLAGAVLRIEEVAGEDLRWPRWRC